MTEVAKQSIRHASRNPVRTRISSALFSLFSAWLFHRLVLSSLRWGARVQAPAPNGLACTLSTVMKRTKEQPSVLGLLLLVTGMLLLSIVLYSLASSGNITAQSGKVLLGLGGAAVVSLGAGAALSGRKHK